MDKCFIEEQKFFFKEVLNDLLRNLKEPVWQDGPVKGDELDVIEAEKENMKVLKLKNRTANYLTKIKRALWKIENDLYGECEDCSGTISVERLRARPTAELCIHCKEEKEAIERSSGRAMNFNNVLQFPGKKKKVAYEKVKIFQ